MNYANMIEEKRLKQGFIIATLISTIVGTFTTGINLFDRIQDKRNQHKTDSGQDEKIRALEKRVNEVEGGGGSRKSRRDPELRDSLEYSGPVVQREYDQHYASLGRRFAEGDIIAQTQLQSQIITLQSTVIKLLEEALFTGRMPDINKLYNASEFAREGSLRALREQYQRMLQSAPLQRPGGPVRRISSTPSLRDGGGGPPPGYHRPRHALTFDKAGPLFCPYAEELQKTKRPLARGFLRGGSGACPACDMVIPIEEGHSWKIDKELVRERMSRHEAGEVVEIVEERTFLLSNRFLVKCHRGGSGFACYLCFRNRDSDTLCRGMESLVNHVLDKHEIREYEEDPDITPAPHMYR